MPNQLITKSSIDVFIRNQLSERTQKAYRSDLRTFKAFIGSAELLDIDSSTLIGYREALRRDYAPSTVNRNLSTVRSLFQWLTETGILEFDPAKPVKLLPDIDNANTPALSDSDALKLLKASSANPRHFAMVSVLLYLGLRRSEVTGLKWEDLQTGREGVVLNVLGKGSKYRRIPVPKPVVDALKTITATPSRALECGYIFPSKSGSKLDSKQVWRVVRRYCKRAGITVVSPHSLRATACSNAIDQGSNFVELQYAFGWESPTMVNRYDKRRGEIKSSAIWNINYEVKK